MDLLPDVGTWLLRSVRRTGNTSDNPISVVERLNSLPHPLRNADKDTLVGAVLSLGPSLQLALHMLMELLPEDESRGRLGEVLCPTLGHLQRSLEETLSYLEPKRLLGYQGADQTQLPVRSKTPLPSAGNAQSDRDRERGMDRDTASVSEFGSRKDKPESGAPQTTSKEPSQATHRVQGPMIQTPTAQQQPSPPRIDQQLDQEIALTDTFPSLQQSNLRHVPRPEPPPPSTSQYSDAHSYLSPQPSQAEAAPVQSTPRPSTPNTNQSRSRYSGSGGHSRRENPAADLALMKELRAEMRVNAAIQVAVDSLEFADGQMKIVRDVHRLHGSGSFELLQKHFYEGYNRILFRALELEQREFDSPSGSPVNSPGRGHRHDQGWDAQGRQAVGGQADDGDEGYEGSGGLVSSPTKITVRSGSPSEGSGSPVHSRRHAVSPGPHLTISQSTPGAPNVTPEHINTSYHASNTDAAPPPPLILFNNQQTEPISLPPLPPIHPQAGGSSPTSRPRPRTANPGHGGSGTMRTRWDDAVLSGSRPGLGANGRPLVRRNTVQGQGPNSWSNGGQGGGSQDRLVANASGTTGIPPRAKPSLKRRLSLAEELALVDEDSDEEDDAETDEEGHGQNDVNNKPSQSSSDSESESQSKESSSEEEEDDDDESDDDESESDADGQPSKVQPAAPKTTVQIPTVTPADNLNAPKTIPRAAVTASIAAPGTSPVTVSDVEAKRKSVGLQGASRLPRPQSSRPGTPLGWPQTPIGRPQTPSSSRLAGRSSYT